MLSTEAHTMYRDLDKVLNGAVGRLIIKRRVGKRLFHTLLDFVMPGMRWYLQWKEEGRGDDRLNGWMERPNADVSRRFLDTIFSRVSLDF